MSGHLVREKWELLHERARLATLVCRVAVAMGWRVWVARQPDDSANLYVDLPGGRVRWWVPAEDRGLLFGFPAGHDAQVDSPVDQAAYIGNTMRPWVKPPQYADTYLPGGIAAAVEHAIHRPHSFDETCRACVTLREIHSRLTAAR